jgi:hypothetical protein
MKKILGIIILVLAFAVPVMAQTADVTIAVTKSLDDPTPRTSVFPASLSPVFRYYVVEQNGALLAQQCLPGCTSLTITGLADGTYNYRVAAVVEVTRSDGTKALTYGWSAVKGVTVACGTAAVPSAPTLGLTSQVCK